jgi:hypothetical protein
MRCEAPGRRPGLQLPSHEVNCPVGDGVCDVDSREAAKGGFTTNSSGQHRARQPHFGRWHV